MCKQNDFCSCNVLPFSLRFFKNFITNAINLTTVLNLLLSGCMRPLSTKVYRFNFTVAVIWVIFPFKSNTSVTFDRYCLLVRLNGNTFVSFLFVSWLSLIHLYIKWQHIFTGETFHPCCDNTATISRKLFGGSILVVILLDKKSHLFNKKSPQRNTNSNWSALSRANSSKFSPDKQSST